MIERRLWKSLTVGLTALAATTGCNLYENGQSSCPCSTGWTCCPGVNACVRAGATCPSRGGPMPDANPFAWPDAPLPPPDGVAGPPPDAVMRPPPDAAVPPSDGVTPQTLVKVVVATGQGTLTWIGEDTAVGDMPAWLDAASDDLMTFPPDHGLGPDWPGDIVNSFPTPVEIAAFTSARLAIDDPYVADDADGTILVIQGSSVAPLATGQVHPRDVAVDSSGNYVYWTTYGHGDTKADGTVARVPAEGGPVQILAGGLAGPGPLSVTGTYVYFATDGKTAGGSEILRVPLAGGTPQVLATGQTHPTDIIGGTDVYWATTADASSTGHVMRLELPSGKPQVLLDDAHNPTELETSHGAFCLNDYGINEIHFSSDGASATAKLIVPLRKEAGRRFWAPPSAASDGYGLVWTNPQEGTVEAFLYEQ